MACALSTLTHHLSHFMSQWYLLGPCRQSEGARETIIRYM